ncbi:hypothetical protein [Pedobacter frigoris]|uniref:hypothetical protein n=1 Tax=Pedobacter frigoris TaxID=2571272 RepID=UPI002931C946|nr:hypothetical protein [Pedobacter frigoris]
MSTNGYKTEEKIDFEEYKLNVQTDNKILIQSLFTTAIVTYAKWFTNSSGGKKPKLEAAVIYKNTSRSIQKTHEMENRVIEAIKVSKEAQEGNVTNI